MFSCLEKNLVSYEIFTSPVLDEKHISWILNFRLEEFPQNLQDFFYKELKNYFYYLTGKTLSPNLRFENSEIEKLLSFTVKDLYKFLAYTEDKLSYKVGEHNIWWYELICDVRVILLKHLVKYNSVYAKFFAHLLAFVLKEKLNSQILESLQNTTSESVSLENILEEILNNLNSFEKLKTFWEKFLEKVNFYLISNFKKDPILSFTETSKILKVKIPRSVLLQVKSISKVLYEFYKSCYRTQIRRLYPRIPDYTLLDETLWTERLATYNFLDTDFYSRLEVNVYVDKSSSMQQILKKNFSKMDIVKAILKELLRMGVKVKKFYIFDTEIQRIPLSKFPKILPYGGTSIGKVIRHIFKKGEPSLIISDFEDRLLAEEKKILRKIKERVSTILISSYPWVYDEWKKELNFTFCLSPENF